MLRSSGKPETMQTVQVHNQEAAQMGHNEVHHFKLRQWKQLHDVQVESINMF